MLDSFFISGVLPSYIEHGSYQLTLVVLSYAVASFASYTALSLSQQLVSVKNLKGKYLFHLGGAFAMGAGIWSMHFIGMLSYKMHMAVHYNPELTFISMLIAIAVSYGVLGIVAREQLTLRQVLTGSILMGIGICGMHYTGMASMVMDADLRYTPALFLLSVVIAIVASAAALWIAFTLARHTSVYRYLFQMAAALVMGAGICGMHYTGMAASVMIPYAGHVHEHGQDFEILALTIAGITTIILALALAAGFYRKTQAEVLLASSESKLRAMIEHSLDAVITMDENGLIMEWNAQAETIFGWPRAEAIGQSLAALIIPPAHRDAHSKGLQRFLADGTGPMLNKRIEVSALNKQGKLFPVELAITAQNILDHYFFTAFIRDITERKRDERERALLASIVASSDDPIISKTLQSIITSWNAAAERLFGYSASEAIGQHISLIIPPERLPEEDYIIGQISANKSVDHFETARVTKNGRAIEVSVTVSPVHDAAGNVIGASKIIHDITMRKQADREREKLILDLKRSNQELDDFAYIASHDLKEPLRGLFNNASFLLEDYNDKLDAEGRGRLQRLGYLCQRMESLVNDLLYFSRLGRQELAIQQTDLNKVIHDIGGMIETTLKDSNGEILIPRPLPVIVCDKVRITEVFRNLIVNAIKYNDSHRKTVEIGCLDEVVRPYGTERSVFYVRDNGIGIEKEFFEEIFRIFKRLNVEDDNKKGTGVGLTFVKKIIERHGGRIWLESELGKGSTFYFTIV
ncbi:MAG TPA: PAS domain S-box protein [Rickettsiales bacterium]|nr:PAS domain S-box protein [Rickettsiales bacterium]